MMDSGELKALDDFFGRNEYLYPSQRNLVKSLIEDVNRPNTRTGSNEYFEKAEWDDVLKIWLRRALRLSFVDVTMSKPFPVITYIPFDEYS